ncbi:hypothetical protein EYF80_067332 [Liparis tanakae]|uniref:Uncharacterized protein n=1 Tax=Liparis tanakae TaxID=230148 RepID=A0A4Z2E198_9TELE|nr:hypothetical protein EYF80_067332 [Liparis tanakae]
MERWRDGEQRTHSRTCSRGDGRHTPKKHQKVVRNPSQMKASSGTRDEEEREREVPFSRWQAEQKRCGEMWLRLHPPSAHS